MPASGWSPIGSIGYRYSDSTLTDGPVKVAQIKKTPSGTFRVKVLLKDGGPTPISVVPGGPSTSVRDQLRDRDGGRRVLRRHRGRGSESEQRDHVQGVERRRAGGVRDPVQPADVDEHQHDQHEQHVEHHRRTVLQRGRLRELQLGDRGR